MGRANRAPNNVLKKLLFGERLFTTSPGNLSRFVVMLSPLGPLEKQPWKGLLKANSTTLTDVLSIAESMRSYSTRIFLCRLHLSPSQIFLYSKVVDSKLSTIDCNAN